VNERDLPALPRLALLEVRAAIAEGDAKYGEASRYTGGARRHFEGAARHAARRLLGQETDASGARTVAHEIARLLIALEIELREEIFAKTERPAGGEIGERISAFRSEVTRGPG